MLEKYSIALQTNSKEIRFSTIEIGMLITELTELLADKIKRQDYEADGGTFK